MKTIIKATLLAVLLAGLYSCTKEEKLNVKIENYDTFVPGKIDEWIKTNLTDPYNIEVVYRYQRNMHDINKNIAPANEDKVIPQMDVVIKSALAGRLRAHFEHGHSAPGVRLGKRPGRLAAGWPAPRPHGPGPGR